MLALGSIKNTLFIAEKVFLLRLAEMFYLVYIAGFNRVPVTNMLLVLHRVHVHLYFIEYCREYSDVSYISYGYQVYDIK